MQKISIVIPSFNGEKLLTVNLSRLINLFPHTEIIIVDDGSSDKTTIVLSKLKTQNSKLKTIRNNKNLGFSSSANRGILSASNPLVLLLNNDCLPENNFLNVILPYFNDKKTFAVSCLEKTKGLPRGRGIGGFKKGLLFHQAGKLNKNNTLWAFGASTVYNKKIFEKLGGFDEDYNPFYWEDFDLSYRALKSGYNIYFEKKAIVYHQTASTIGRLYRPKKITILSFRNQLFTCWKNITDESFLIKHILWLPYHLIITSIKTSGLFFIGFIAALIKLPKILAKRKLNQFVLTDKEVLTPFKNEIQS